MLLSGPNRHPSTKPGQLQVYGDTAKWVSGTNDADFRIVDGLPLLPPEWSIAHELLLEAQLSKTL